MVETKANGKSVADGAQNGHSRDLQAIPAYKKPYPPKRSRKAPALKQEVIARRIAKQNKTRISNELGISRNTVTAILEESNTDRLVESGRLQVCELIPESIRVVAHRLEMNSETAAFEVLKGVGVLGKDTKPGKPPDHGLTLAIQNLMGNVQVVENKPVVQIASTTPETALHNNAAAASTSQLSETKQVQENQ